MGVKMKANAQNGKLIRELESNGYVCREACWTRAEAIAKAAEYRAGGMKARVVSTSYSDRVYVKGKEN